MKKAKPKKPVIHVKSDYTETLGNKSWLQRELNLKNKTLVQVAKELGVSRNTVKAKADFFGIKTKSKGRPLELTVIERKENKLKLAKENLDKLKERNFVQFCPHLIPSEISMLDKFRKASKKSYHIILKTFLETYLNKKALGQTISISLIERDNRIQKNFYIPLELKEAYLSEAKKLNLDLGNFVSIVVDLSLSTKK